MRQLFRAKTRDRQQQQRMRQSLRSERSLHALLSVMQPGQGIGAQEIQDRASSSLRICTATRSIDWPASSTLIRLGSAAARSR